MTRLEAFRIDDGTWRSFRADTVEPPPPPPPPTGDHFFNPDTWLNEYYTRSQSGPYRVKGDVKDGSPGDWEKTVSETAAFMSDPTWVRWVQTKAVNNEALSSGDPYPGDANIYEISRLTTAAFYAMVTGSTSHRDAVKAELVWQANEPSTNYANDTTYKRRPGGSDDWSPIFALAVWLNNLCYAYDCIGRDSFTSAQRDQIDLFLYRGANWMAEVVHAHVSASRLPNRFPNRDYSVINDADSAVYKTYDDGPWVSHLQMTFNNRRSHIASAGTNIANYLRWAGYVAPTSGGPGYGYYSLADLALLGRLFLEETVRFSTWPNGSFAELERNRDTSLGDNGWRYATFASGPELFRIARSFYLYNGDTTALNYTTTLGGGSDTWPNDGAPSQSGYRDGKSLKFILFSLNRDIPDQWGRRYNGHRLFRADLSPGQITDIGMTPYANTYYNDAFLKACYERENAVGMTQNTYKDPSGHAFKWDAWMGGLHQNPAGSLFMYGRMENV